MSDIFCNDLEKLLSQSPKYFQPIALEIDDDGKHKIKVWQSLRVKLTPANLTRSSRDAILDRVNYFVLANGRFKSVDNYKGVVCTN